MNREITFRPAWDKRNNDPKKNYGIHGADMIFILKGELGAIQFVVYTGWHLPHVADEYKYKGSKISEPLAADVGYHSPKPMYEGQQQMQAKCEHLNGKPCYYDGSGLHAEKVFDMLIQQGSDAVWTYLESYYMECFGELI